VTAPASDAHCAEQDGDEVAALVRGTITSFDRPAALGVDPCHNREVVWYTFLLMLIVL